MSSWLFHQGIQINEFEGGTCADIADQRLGQDLDGREYALEEAAPRTSFD